MSESIEAGASAERTLQVLFFNEGDLGTHILGQSRLESALRVGMSACPNVQARFAGLSQMDRWSAALAQWPIPGLAALGVDMRTLRWHAVQSLRARRRLGQELRLQTPDVLHLHSQSIAFFAAGIMRRLPVVLSVDATVREWSSMPAWAATRGGAANTATSRALERRVLRRAALVTAWTTWARRGVEREQPDANVVEHHPGIDLESYAPAPRRKRPRPRILFVGGRFAEKGGEDLLAALEGRLGSEVELDLVTPAAVPERDGVRLHRLSASDPQLRSLYQQADLVCLPTYGDTNPWVILEAMACGTAVVSSEVGAIPEMLDHGRAGTIVPCGDRRSLAQAIDTLLSDPALRAALGREGRALCKRRYDAVRQSALLAQRMRDLVEARAQRGRGRGRRGL